jgi:aryl-alcohol dehydrogenase-like predicted oxidoreductase
MPRRLRTLPAALTAKLPVIARAPLRRSAAAAPTAGWRPGDRRAAWGPRLAAIVPDLAALAAFTREVPPAAASTAAGRQRLDGLRRHPEVVHATVAALAIAAARARPGVAAVVIGARTPAHAAAWWPTPPPPVPAAIAAALAAQPWGEAWYRRRDER